jgi:hypothetical protein
MEASSEAKRGVRNTNAVPGFYIAHHRWLAALYKVGHTDALYKVGHTDALYKVGPSALLCNRGAVTQIIAPARDPYPRFGASRAPCAALSRRADHSWPSPHTQRSGVSVFM